VDVDDATFAVSERRLRRAYRLLRARHDREACTLLRAHHAELVAVVLDVDMPGSVLDGLMLTRVLRGRVPSQAVPPFARNLPDPNAPIVLVTERADSYSEQELVQYGGDGLIGKPVEIHKLTLALLDWRLRGP
jgi:CheY-like chemotaxis protein